MDNENDRKDEDQERDLERDGDAELSPTDESAREDAEDVDTVLAADAPQEAEETGSDA